VEGAQFLVMTIAVLGVAGLASVRVRQSSYWRARHAGGMAYLGGADLIGANLARASLAGANASGARLAGDDLHGANRVGADLRGEELGQKSAYRRSSTSWAGCARLNPDRAV
jgi:uncharacterized protein YjbI with pentapeptide repeats